MLALFLLSFKFRIGNYFNPTLDGLGCLMEGINYPGLAAQRSAHKILISKIAEFKQEADNGMAIFVASKLVNTAVDWLKNHIFVMDKKYQAEMNSNGIK